MEINIKIPQKQANKQKSSELLYDPTIPVLGINPKEFKSEYNRDNCTFMFIAVLFTIAKL
jgi:hypothetical protein